MVDFIDKMNNLSEQPILETFLLNVSQTNTFEDREIEQMFLKLVITDEEDITQSVEALQKYRPQLIKKFVERHLHKK